MEKMVKAVKLPKGFKDERFERVGDELRIYAVPTQEPYALKNREPMTVINGIWHCSSKDGRKNEVWWPFWDLTVEDFEGYTPETDEQETGKRMIIAAIEQNTATGTWVPKYQLSVDEETGEVVSVPGATPAKNRNSCDAEELCKQYDAENRSGMKTDAVKYLQIARVIKDGRFTWAEAFDDSSKVMDDEGKPINVCDAPNSPKKMLPTGNREIQGTSDFYGNFYEILKHTLVNSKNKNDKAKGFIISGASYKSHGNINPLGDLYRVKLPDFEYSYGVGAAAL